MSAAAALVISQGTIEQLSPRLLAVALRATRQRADAEDIVQETWASVLRSLPTFAGRAPLEAWIVSILRRRIADRMRCSRHSELLDEDQLGGEDDHQEHRLDAREAASVAARAMQELSDLEKTAMRLCDVEDVDRDEASARLGVSRGHLRVLLHRARRKLELRLTAEGKASARP